MFTSTDRARLRSELLEASKRDPPISAVAFTGSAAVDREDEWSDVDLTLAVDDSSSFQEVLSDWTARMYEHHRAMHHVDVRREAWIYRVFLLESALQVSKFSPACALIQAGVLNLNTISLDSRLIGAAGASVCADVALITASKLAEMLQFQTGVNSQ